MVLQGFGGFLRQKGCFCVLLVRSVQFEADYECFVVSTGQQRCCPAGGRRQQEAGLMVFVVALFAGMQH